MDNHKEPGHNGAGTALYIIRHATPDWSRKDIRYDIPPGPPLIDQGKQEAQQLGVFLKEAGVKRLYYSPFERTSHTARIAAASAGIPSEEHAEVMEISPGENETSILKRLWPFWERCVLESKDGPLGIVTHGGPAAILLKHLGMDAALLDKYCHSFDGNNPLPPAGAWKVSRADESASWELNLAFTPKG